MTDAYIYRAALYCDHCGEQLRRERHEYEPVDVEDESSYDSDHYPKGPYREGGGEADSPQHCDECGVFLENPLTPDGMEYVRNAADTAARSYEIAEGVKEGEYSWQDVARYAEDTLRLPGLGEWIRYYLAWGA